MTNGYRFSDAFIQRWTTILCVTIVALVAIGFGLGFVSALEWAPDGLGEVAIGVVVAGFVVPLLAAAVLGGESIKRGGGLVGVLLTYGIVATAGGQSLAVGWVFWTGIGALVLAVAGFWLIGWIAKVPMYLGLPWSHGAVVQRKDPLPGSSFSSDDPRLRLRRPRGGKASRDPRR